MNNIFGFKRFGKLFLKHTTEHFRSYLMSTLVLCGIITIFYAFVTMTGGTTRAGFRISALTIFYLLAGCIFTSTVFSDYGNKNKAISSLTLPVSHLEKFLVGWVYSYLIYTAIFAISFSLVDYCFVQFASQVEDKRSLLKAMDDVPILGTLFYFYSILHSVAIFGAIYFKSMHFIKTALCFFATIILLTIFHNALLRTLVTADEVMFSQPFLNGLGIRSETKIFYMIRLDDSMKGIYSSIMLVGITAMLWIGSFFEIKEKQI